MKLNKMAFALALTALLATTGCRHGFSGKVTTLPGHRGPAITSESNPTTIPNTSPIDNGAPLPTSVPTPLPTSGFGSGQPIPTTANWSPDDMNQDRGKLAAYTVHFKFDSAAVQDNEQANVASVAQALVSDANSKLLIEGHCDERGTEEYNRSLGERRALALREALAKDGIDPMRIRTISYGKDKPADPGHDESAWAKNRRGEFVYCTAKTPVQ